MLLQRPRVYLTKTRYGQRGLINWYGQNGFNRRGQVDIPTVQRGMESAGPKAVNLGGPLMYWFMILDPRQRVHCKLCWFVRCLAQQWVKAKRMIFQHFLKQGEEALFSRWSFQNLDVELFSPLLLVTQKLVNYHSTRLLYRLNNQYIDKSCVFAMINSTFWRRVNFQKN